jgi:HAD superfamily hydrolase (TIGR01509 family)
LVIQAVTLDYWDTLYVGASRPERVARRRAALFEFALELGSTVSWEDFGNAYNDSAIEFERVWRSGRGYRTEERIHWLLVNLGVPVPPPSRLAAAARVVDDTIVEFAPSLLPGAAALVEALRARFRLAIISDTGFASGNAQNRVLANDGLLPHFAATIYSMDVGHAKPRGEIFAAAGRALGVEPHEVIHVGDNERTDVGGALASGMRAVRLDAVRDGGPTKAEHVARSLPDVIDYLLTNA